MPKTDEAKAVHTKRILRDAMLSCMGTRDFEQITVNEICGITNFSRSTFYKHYEDKYDLIVDCLYHLVFHPLPLRYDGNLERFFMQVLSVTKEHEQALSKLKKINDTMELKWKIDAMFMNEYVAYFEHKYPKERHEGIPPSLLASYHCFGNMQMIAQWQKNGYVIEKSVLAAYLAKQIFNA